MNLTKEIKILSKTLLGNKAIREIWEENIQLTQMSCELSYRAKRPVQYELNLDEKQIIRNSGAELFVSGMVEVIYSSKNKKRGYSFNKLEKALYKIGKAMETDRGYRLSWTASIACAVMDAEDYYRVKNDKKGKVLNQDEKREFLNEGAKLFITWITSEETETFKKIAFTPADNLN